MQRAGVGMFATVLTAAGVTDALAQTATATAPARSAALAGRRRDLKIISLDRLQTGAQAMMSPAAVAFVSSAAGDEWTLRENRRAFEDFPILTRRLAGFSAKDVDTRVNLLGHNLSSPIIVAPMGVHTMVSTEGEVATAVGVGAAGTIYQSSGASARPLEDIAKATPAPKWFQLYFNADIGVTRDLLLRARAAGYSAIIVTADAIGPGTSDAFLSLGTPMPTGFYLRQPRPPVWRQGRLSQPEDRLDARRYRVGGFKAEAQRG